VAAAASAELELSSQPSAPYNEDWNPAVSRAGIGIYTGLSAPGPLRVEWTIMKCPYCGFGQDRVVDSRESKEADSIRRRRECERCNRRFTTYERIDEIPYMVVKKDGRRERFDRQKVLSGLLRACEKRPVPSSQLEKIVDATEAYLVDAPERERTTAEVGELIMQHLKGLDTVAYIRFASVYRDFKDVREFKEELEGLLGAGRSGKKR
jgi:transcriptional repressor NrdR